jgi:hypothetical protein
MKESLLDKFYNGHLIPADNSCLKNPQLLKLMNDAADSEENLLGMIEGEANDLFVSYSEAIDQIQEIMDKKRYLDGFRTGLRLAMEALNNGK